MARNSPIIGGLVGGGLFRFLVEQYRPAEVDAGEPTVSEREAGETVDGDYRTDTSGTAARRTD